MPALDLPPKPPIDRTRAGVLRISTSVIANLLRLPEGLEVTDARAAEDGSEIALMIEGAPMPPAPMAGEPEQVRLICHTAIDAKTGMTTVSANFEHAPGDRWIMRDSHKRESFL